jgi:peptidoglycan LD-endopeptidase LytH
MKCTDSPVLLAAALLLGAGCAPGERVIGAGLPPVGAGTPHDAYVLHLAAVHGADAARSWEDASRRALRSGLTIPPSFRERVRFPDGDVHAVAYRFPLRAGQRLRVDVRVVDIQRPLFADVFEVVGGRIFRHVQSAPPGAAEVTFAARATAEYVLRLQPELGSGGTVEVAVADEAPLLFPVAGADASAIGGRFGDPRDAGARSHEGVDIFAPRGTAVLAAAGGRVASTRPTPIGGNVVWLEDAATGLSYYYAHLDAVHVRTGQQVGAGEVIGTVGNTGNASGVRPHLHFGIYRPYREAVDPAPFLRSAADLTTLAVDVAALGQWVRLAGHGVRLRGSPGPAGTVLAELPSHTAMFVLGGVGDWHRVVLEDGTSGFVAARFTDVPPDAR